MKKITKKMIFAMLLFAVMTILYRTVIYAEEINGETTVEITTEEPTTEEPTTAVVEKIYDVKDGVLTKYYDSVDRKSFTIPKTIKSIGTGAFQNAVNLTTVKFESGSQVKTIGKNAFSECINLEVCSIPASVTSIKEKAFYNCKKLKKITLRKKVTSIGNMAFSGADSLTLYVYNNSVGKKYAVVNKINWIYTDSEIERQNLSKSIYTKYMSRLGTGASSKFKLKYLQNYVPQGVCVVDNYLVVSMYYKNLKKKSILVLYNKKTGAFVKKIVLPSKDHVGSVVNIKGRLVISLCNISATDYVAVISAKKLKKAKKSKTIKYDYIKKLPGYADIAQYDGSIYWAGRSANISYAKMYGYKVSVKKKKLVFKKKYSYTIPANSQGMVIRKSGNTRIFTITSSYGRTKDSKLITYKVNIKKKKTLGKPVSTSLLPPMAEGMYMTSKQNVYMIFESGAGLYCADPYNTSEIQINNVCKLNLNSLLQM